jgi:D-glycero-beta-D-manno-heptose 1-phosphate adenylyltransferase
MPTELCSHDEILLKVRDWQADGEKVVFTNGCFDILHAGHVRYLAAARELGDRLVVGLNSDASVRRLKGPQRPVAPELDRAEVLSALGAVNAVTLFDDDTPEALIGMLLPDILVKGADWPVEKIAGAKAVIAHGGSVLTVPLLEGRSTTGIIETIIQLHCPKQTGG